METWLGSPITLDLCAVKCTRNNKTHQIARAFVIQHGEIWWGLYCMWFQLPLRIIMIGLWRGPNLWERVRFHQANYEAKAKSSLHRLKMIVFLLTLGIVLSHFFQIWRWVVHPYCHVVSPPKRCIVIGQTQTFKLVKLTQLWGGLSPPKNVVE